MREKAAAGLSGKHRGAAVEVYSHGAKEWTTQQGESLLSCRSKNQNI